MNINYKGEKMKEAFKLLESFKDWWYDKPVKKPKKKRKYRKTSKYWAKRYK